MNNIDLSIIIPVYNVENYLRRGLDSILLQPSSITYVMSTKVIFQMFLLVTSKITEWQKLGI